MMLSAWASDQRACPAEFRFTPAHFIPLHQTGLKWAEEVAHGVRFLIVYERPP